MIALVRYVGVSLSGVDRLYRFLEAVVSIYFRLLQYSQCGDGGVRFDHDSFRSEPMSGLGNVSEEGEKRFLCAVEILFASDQGVGGF
jgi:hypothetical protein